MVGSERIAELLERPLPAPRRDPVGYASARVLEALLESLLALEFLEKGYTRNAAGKAFQAWKALIGALLALEKDRIEKMLRTDKERRWIAEKGVARVPTASLKPLSQLLEEAGYKHLSSYTAMALNLHSYQYHGPDPSGEFSPYPTRESAAKDILLLLVALVELVEGRVKPRLEKEKAWTPEHQQALQTLRQRL
ncbi:PaREP1 family protein [Pyrolobus fumarii]|uniref:PaREP1 family protein n=1 Tax=Pyrolobus fumarii TaxID=54252 RepID=UPI000AF7B792|nr:PaREP1 family protein [Pyrolobus fumarii]